MKGGRERQCGTLTEGRRQGEVDGALKTDTE